MSYDFWAWIWGGPRIRIMVYVLCLAINRLFFSNNCTLYLGRRVERTSKVECNVSHLFKQACRSTFSHAHVRPPLFWLCLHHVDVRLSSSLSTRRVMPARGPHHSVAAANSSIEAANMKPLSMILFRYDWWRVIVKAKEARHLIAIHLGISISIQQILRWMLLAKSSDRNTSSKQNGKTLNNKGTDQRVNHVWVEF